VCACVCACTCPHMHVFEYVHMHVSHRDQEGKYNSLCHLRHRGVGKHPSSWAAAAHVPPTPLPYPPEPRFAVLSRDTRGSHGHHALALLASRSHHQPACTHLQVLPVTQHGLVLCHRPRVHTIRGLRRPPPLCKRRPHVGHILCAQQRHSPCGRST